MLVQMHTSRTLHTQVFPGQQSAWLTVTHSSTCLLAQPGTLLSMDVVRLQVNESGCFPAIHQTCQNLHNRREEAQQRGLLEAPCIYF